MVPLPETVLKIVFFRNTSQQRFHVALDVIKVSKSLSLQGIFNFGKRQKSQGAKSGK